MQLTKAQVSQLKAKGLADNDIATYAKKYGYTLAPSGSSVAHEIGAAINKRVTNIAQTAKRVVTGKQGFHSAMFDAGGQAAGAAGDVAGAVTDAITPAPIKNALERVGLKAASQPAVKSLMTKAQQFYQSLPEEEQRHLDAVMGYASGASALAGAGAAGAIAKTAASATVKPALRVAGRSLSGAGETIYKSAITPTVKEATRIQSFKAGAPFLTRVGNQIKGIKTAGEPVTRADTALKKGILGRETDIGVQATREAEKLFKETIAPALKTSPAQLPVADLFAPVMKRIAATAEPGRKKALEEAFEAIKADYAGQKPYSLEAAQEIKKGLDEFTPEKIFNGKSVASEYRTLQNDMANAIRQKTYEALQDVNIKQSYLDYGNLAELRKIGVKALTNATAKGGFGTFWSGVWCPTSAHLRQN